MSDFDPAATQAFPLKEAADWIGRWRAMGGGFYIRDSEDEVSVQLARQPMADAHSGDVYKNACEAMETQITLDARLRMAVMVLARDAWDASKLRTMEPGAPN